MPEGVIYERQNLITDLKIPQQASVVGCGGTGFWTAFFLAMSGVEELILIDDDKLEASNLNRLPVESSYVGMYKVDVLGSRIGSIRNNVRYERHRVKIEKEEDCSLLRGAIFCCTDNLKSQQLVCAYAKKNNLPYQRIGYDGTMLNVSKAFPLSFNEDEGPIGYTQTPSWVIPAVVAAALGVSSKLYKELCIMDDLGKIHIQNCSHVSGKIVDKLEEKGYEEGRRNILNNISEYIPDDYGYCGDCDRGRCDNCDYYSPGDVDEERRESYENGRTEGYDNGKEEGHDNGYDEAWDTIINQLKSGVIASNVLQEAINNYIKKQEEMKNEQKEKEKSE